jgi:uncharacterized membrane protein YkvA (DUF1232 family)
VYQRVGTYAEAPRRPLLGNVIGRIPGVSRIIALLVALRDPAVPRWGKWAILLAVIYAVMPLDAIPDFLPVLGWLDDLGIVTLALFLTRFIVKDYHLARAKQLLGMAA